MTPWTFWRCAASARARRWPSSTRPGSVRAGDHVAGSAGPGDGGFGLLPRMAWLAREDPDAAAQARWLMPSWDALGLWLSGEAATSVQGHETPLGAAELEAIGRPTRTGAGTAARSARRWACSARRSPRRSACPRAIPVMAGVNDGTASHARCRACASPGDAVDTGGTSGGLAIYADRRDRRRGRAVRRAGAAARTLGRGRGDGGARGVGRLAARARPGRADVGRGAVRGGGPVPAGAGGLVFLPYLAGERAPLFDESARGAFVGLTLAHGRAAPGPRGPGRRGVRDALSGGAAGRRRARRSRELRLAGRAAPGDAVGADQGGRAGRAGRRSRRGGVRGPRCGDPGGRRRGCRHRPRGRRDRDDVGRDAHRAGSSTHARYDELFAVYRDLYPAIAPTVHALAG